MEGCGFRHWGVGHGGVWIQTLGGRAWRGVWHWDIRILLATNYAGTVLVSHIQHQNHQ